MVKRARNGLPPVVVNLDQLASLAAMQATHDEIAAFFNVSDRTVLNWMKKPKIRAAYENGKHKGRLNLRRLQWRHANGLDPNGNFINGSQSSAVNMTIHMSKQPYWLNEGDRSLVETSPIELVITRIERVIVDSSSDPHRQGVPALIEAQAI